MKICMNCNFINKEEETQQEKQTKKLINNCINAEAQKEHKKILN